MIVLGHESHLKPSGNKNYFVHSPTKRCLFGGYVFMPTIIQLLGLFLEAPYVTSCNAISKLI
jgi:hypothetical protein